MKIPHYGVGTWLLSGDECKTIVRTALQNGIRLIDTANMYENEVEVGVGMIESGIPREECYLISKLDPELHSYDGAIKSVKASLAKLQTPYIDLILIHTPRPGGIVEAYRGLVECQKQGLVREVGVSNFGRQHILALLEAGLPTPAVNEFEVHLWNHMREVRQEMHDLGVPVIGYCPLARGKRFEQVPVVAQVAAELGIDEATLALRWSITEGLVTIPKTGQVSRLLGMISSLLDKQKATLSADIMERLKAADEGFFASNAVKSMWEDVVINGPTQ